jgi:TPP-dependent 2-oxoacid decarboxylase
MESTLMLYTGASYLVPRFVQIGLKHHRGVTGDYALVLPNQLLTSKFLKQIYRTDEWDLGFSAEGYAQAQSAARRAAPIRQRTL